MVDTTFEGSFLAVLVEEPRLACEDAHFCVLPLEAGFGYSSSVLYVCSQSHDTTWVHPLIQAWQDFAVDSDS